MSDWVRLMRQFMAENGLPMVVGIVLALKPHPVHFVV